MVIESLLKSSANARRVKSSLSEASSGVDDEGETSGMGLGTKQLELRTLDSEGESDVSRTSSPEVASMISSMSLSGKA